MRWMAVDFGERRIGLAISDPNESVVVPLDTVERTTDRVAVARLAALAAAHGIDALLIGEPRSTSGDAAERARAFGAKLARRTGLPVTWVDETLTSAEAQHRLRQVPGGRRAQLDAVAAAVLLEELLERRRREATAR